MKVEKQTIKICSCHQEQVPLIWTFAFPGAEYWCPACGYTSGMFGAGENVSETPDLVVSKAKWVEISNDYLTAKSRLGCHSLEWDGKRISPSELPEEEIERCKKVIAEWKYKID